MQTIVPLHPDGDLDLRFKGTTAEVKPFGPPQSALPSIIQMSMDQYDRLKKLSYTQGDHQEMWQRIAQRIKNDSKYVYAQVLSTDMALIKKALEKNETGAWQELVQEIMNHTAAE